MYLKAFPESTVICGGRQTRKAGCGDLQRPPHRAAIDRDRSAVDVAGER